MLHIALYRPEIPPNTGNIIRLAANMGAALHLIHPLGFEFCDKRVRRAGLDYHELSNITHHESTEAFLECFKGQRMFACTTRTTTRYTEPDYQDGDVFLFGSETKGLPDSLREENAITIPMCEGSRSLNLSNSVAIILFEAWRQLKFSV